MPPLPSQAGFPSLRLRLSQACCDLPHPPHLPWDGAEQGTPGDASSEWGRGSGEGLGLSGPGVRASLPGPGAPLLPSPTCLQPPTGPSYPLPGGEGLWFGASHLVVARVW